MLGVAHERRKNSRFSFSASFASFSMTCHSTKLFFSVENIHSDVVSVPLCVNKAFILCRCVRCARDVEAISKQFSYKKRHCTSRCRKPWKAILIQLHRALSSSFRSWIKYDWKPQKHCFRSGYHFGVVTSAWGKNFLHFFICETTAKKIRSHNNNNTDEVLLKALRKAAGKFYLEAMTRGETRPFTFRVELCLENGFSVNWIETFFWRFSCCWYFPS